MRAAVWLWAVLAVTAGAVLSGAAAASAQSMAGGTESERLREAAQLEAGGELEGAESVLREVLESRSTSVPALLAMERVLELQGRLEDLVPPLEAAVEVEPRSALLNQVLLRTYSALDRVDALERAGERWMSEVPALEVPYRELAAVWEERGALDRAREVLERGRATLERPDALALELGDLYAARGEPDRAVRQWNAAVGLEARGMGQVRRRLRALPDGGAAVVGDLVSLLVADPTTPQRLAAAMELAVDGGLAEPARAAADRVLAELPPGDRGSFLVDLARRADGARLTGLALWAYEGVAEAEEGAGAEEGRLLAVRNRIAELALELGDTATATANYQAVEAAYARGTPQRREAAALRIQLMAAQSPDSARAALRTFREEYPEVPEVDGLSAAVAESLLTESSDEARSVLAGVRGPGSSYLRGRMALSDGDVASARTAFMTAVPDLRGAEATRVLALVTLLGRVSDAAGTLVGEAMALADGGDLGAAVDHVRGRVARLPAEDRATMLAFAADLADGAGLPDDAVALWRRLVEDYPRSDAAPEALLELARALRAEAGGALEARELLERLIVEYPRSALVPQARRELQGMPGGVSVDVQEQGSNR